MGRFDLNEAGNLIRRLMSGGMDEQTAAIVARGARTGVPQTLPGEGLVRPPVVDPDAARFLDTLSYREAAGLVPPLAPSRAADMSLGSPLFDDMSRAADAMNPGRLRQRANVIPGGRRGSPNPAGDLKRIAAQNIEEAADASRAAGAAGRRNSALANAAGAAAVVGGAAGLGYMAQPGTAPGSRKPKKDSNQDLTESGNPADLQEPPVRDPRSETLAGPPAEDYSMQARQLINQLNDMRRKAGGEVPQAPQMMKEINRLLALGDKQRNTPGYKIPASDPARDPYQQARTLIDQVNNMYSQGFSESDPRVQKIMARVRELQSQGDAMRNNRKNYR